MNPYIGLIKSRRLLEPNPLDIKVSFIDGPKIEIRNGKKDKYYCAVFIDAKTGERQHIANLQTNHWSKAHRAYYTDWSIEVYDDKDKLFEYRLDLKGKDVYIAFDSKALGDTIAWMPYIEEFRAKHSCNIICSTFHNFLFKKSYPQFKFIAPGESYYDVFAMYTIGWFGDGSNKHRNPIDCRTIPLQKIATDYLGLDYKELKPNIYYPNERISKKKMIAIGPESTAKAKLWNNPNGWQEIATHYKNLGYEVVYLGLNDVQIKDIKQLPVNKRNLEEAIRILKESQVFIGLGSGLSWLAWALNVPVVMISGFSKPWHELNTPYRIHDEKVCNSCFNNINFTFDKGDWNWCPAKKNFECTTSITAEEVIRQVDLALSVM